MNMRVISLLFQIHTGEGHQQNLKQKCQLLDQTSLKYYKLNEKSVTYVAVCLWASLFKQKEARYWILLSTFFP